MTYIFAFCIGTLKGFTHHLCAQLCGRNVFQAATKCTNGGAHTADNDYFTAHLILLRFQKIEPQILMKNDDRGLTKIRT
jgi:hypothetical protein